jgi:hypothetical protein
MGIPRPDVIYLLKDSVRMTSVDADRCRFLSQSRFPGRVNALEAGWLLGFSTREISILVVARLLKPLGHPKVNAPKFFHRPQIDSLEGDRAWMSKACDAISSYWKIHNECRESIVLC